jgi:hypothetical protein
MWCSSCDHSPCKVTLYKDLLESNLRALGDSNYNDSKKRNHLYSCFVFEDEGRVGSLYRHRIPECIVSFILSICPDVYDDNNDDLKCIIRFNQGEKVKVSVSFENETVPMWHVLDFVKQSPVQGWHVTLYGEYNMKATMICSSASTWREIELYCLFNDYEHTHFVHYII